MSLHGRALPCEIQNEWHEPWPWHDPPQWNVMLPRGNFLAVRLVPPEASELTLSMSVFSIGMLLRAHF